MVNVDWVDNLAGDFGGKSENDSNDEAEKQRKALQRRINPMKVLLSAPLAAIVTAPRIPTAHFVEKAAN